MNKTLVTGSTGLVGFHIVQALLRRGMPVKALVRSLDKARALLPEGCELVQGDITDQAAVRRAMQGCCVVYHAAGFPEQWLPDVGLFQRVNVGGTQHAVEAALAQGVEKFIYTSTIDVFAGQAGQVFDESLLDPQPRGTTYERSKQAADQLVVAAMQRGLPAIFLHPAGIYGPGPSSSPGANAIIAQLRSGRLPVLPPGGFGLVFAPDVGEGHVLAAELAPLGSRYILCEGFYSLTELAQVVYAEAGLDKRTPFVVPPAAARLIASFGEWLSQYTHRPPLLPKGALVFLLWQAIPSSQKAQGELDWKATPLKEGIRETIDFLNKIH